MAVKDSNGNELNEGDSVTVTRDLKVGGSSMKLKRGQLLKKIHLTAKEGEIESREGKRTIVVKTCFVKKA